MGNPHDPSQEGPQESPNSLILLLVRLRLIVSFKSRTKTRNEVSSRCKASSDTASFLLALKLMQEAPEFIMALNNVCRLNKYTMYSMFLLFKM